MCNLSWSSLKDTLALLESKGYIEDLSDDQKRRHYSITSEGRGILEYYSKVEALVQV